MRNVSETTELVSLPRDREILPPWQRYGAALSILVLTSITGLLSGERSGDELWRLMQLLAITLCAVIGGMGPGLLAAIGFIGIELFEAHFAHRTGGAEIRLLVVEAAIISALIGLLSAARKRARAADIARALLEKQMIEIGDNERRRFGHDLHDGLGQQLTGIALLSESLAHKLEGSDPSHAARAEEIGALVSETIGWTRELARGLSPLTLETDGLVAAIEEVARRARRLFEITCRFDCEHASLPIEDRSAVHVFRIVQEAVSNSVKHGKAKNVQIYAGVESGEVVFTISDDGCGLSAKTVAKPGIGLQIMKYRANLIGARLAVGRVGLASGAVVSCSVPIDVSRDNRVLLPVAK